MSDYVSVYAQVNYADAMAIVALVKELGYIDIDYCELISKSDNGRVSYGPCDDPGEAFR